MDGFRCHGNRHGRGDGAGIAPHPRASPSGVLVAQLVVLVWWLGVLVASDVAWFVVIPNLAWAERLVTVFGDGLDQVAQYAAPAPVKRGILLLLVGGAGLVGLLVDLFAVELRRVPLAGVALGAVYAVAASVAPGGLAWIWFVPAAAGFLALLVAEGRTRVVRWGRSAGPSADAHRDTGDRFPRPQRSSRGHGRDRGRRGLPAIVPGLTEGMFGSGGGSGGGGGREIRTDNPIVDLKGDLSQPEDVLVLSYETKDPVPGYIRRAVLDVFNGQEWKTSEPGGPGFTARDRGMRAPPGLIRTEEGPSRSIRFEVDEQLRVQVAAVALPGARDRHRGRLALRLASLDVVPRKATQAATTPCRGWISLRRRALRAAAPRGRVRRHARLPTTCRPKPSTWPNGTAGQCDQRLRQAPRHCRRCSAPRAVRLRAPDRAGQLLVGLGRTSCRTAAGTVSSSPRAWRSWPGPSASRPGSRSGTCPGHRRRTAAGSSARRGTRMARTVLPGDRMGALRADARNPHRQPAVVDDASGRWRDGSPNVPDAAGGGNQAEGPIPGQEDLPVGAGDAGVGTAASTWIAVGLAVAGGALVLAVPTIIARTRRAWRWRKAGGDRVGEAEAAWSDLRDTSRDAGFEWDPASTPRRTGQELAARTSLDEDSGDLLTHLVTTTERARYSTTPNDTEGLRADSAMLRRTVLRSRSVLQRFGAAMWPSATRDVMIMSANRVADGFDWTDLPASGCGNEPADCSGRRG